jgi:hypothetical protein
MTSPYPRVCAPAAFYAPSYDLSRLQLRALGAGFELADEVVEAAIDAAKNGMSRHQVEYPVSTGPALSVPVLPVADQLLTLYKLRSKR